MLKEKRVTGTEFCLGRKEILDEVKAGKYTAIITSWKEPICALVPYEEYVKLREAYNLINNSADGICTLLPCGEYVQMRATYVKAKATS